MYKLYSLIIHVPKVILCYLFLLQHSCFPILYIGYLLMCTSFAYIVVHLICLYIVMCMCTSSQIAKLRLLYSDC